MSQNTSTQRKLTLPEVQELVESIGEENLDQLQRRTLDYASKFAKAKKEAVEKLVASLTTDFGLEEDEAIQVVNCMPKSVDELRVFLAGGRKILDTQTPKKIIDLLDANRKLK